MGYRRNGENKTALPDTIQFCSTEKYFTTQQIATRGISLSVKMLNFRLRA